MGFICSSKGVCQLWVPGLLQREAVSSAVLSDLGKLLFLGQLSVAWSSPQQNYTGNSVPGNLDWETSVSTNSGLAHPALPSGICFKCSHNGVFLHTLLITFWFGHLWLLTLAQEGRQEGYFIFLQIVPVFPGDWATGGLERQVVLLYVPARGTGPPTSPVAMGCLGISDFRGLFWNLFWTEDQKVWNRKISVFFQVPFNKYQCGKTHKEKLCGWFLLLVCVFIFLIWRSSHIYCTPWKPQ